MKNLTQFSFAILILLLTCNKLEAQISEGGVPPGFTLSGTVTKQAKEPLLIPFDDDVEQLKQEDSVNEANGEPMRMAKIISTNLSINNSGEWITLPSGQRIWQLTVKTPDALATLLYYDDFYIPEGAKLFIYNQDKTQVLGAYTHITNPKGKEFATEFVAGDVFTIEYVEAENANAQHKPRIVISGIGYGYNHLAVYNRKTTKSFGSAASCMVNINCSEGSAWQDQKRGVARTITPIGSNAYYCSGTLLNNTANDYTPYFLSAHHCFYVDNSIYAGASGLNRMVFYFQYEQSGCENLPIEPESKTMVGAQMLVDIDIQGGSDGVLLKLNQAVPADYNVYYNGWDINNVAPQSGVCIHHPGGDVKKISTYTTPVSSSTWQGDATVGAVNGHWKVSFAATANGHGVTQGGSSGSPLFNQNQLVVGTLTGGGSSCSSPKNPEYYGKLWYHWNEVAGANKQMKPYLDPLNTGELTLQGCYITATADFMVESTTLYASETVRFINRSYGADTYDWSFQGGVPASSTEKNPSITYNTAGEYDVTLVINKGQKNEQVKTVQKYITCVLKLGPCPTVVQIGSGNQENQFPLGLRQRQSFSSSLYTRDELGGKSGAITQLSWYANAQSDKIRTLTIYLKEADDDVITPAGWLDEISGLTPVYCSNNNFKNTAGWNTIILDKPFVYSGTKNLKVIVRANASTTATDDFVSAKCAYSSAANKHMRWVSANSVLPVTNGVVNNNRPNIKITFDEGCVKPPVADFLPMEHIVYFKENFDGFDYYNFPSNGWRVGTLIGGLNSWKTGNVTPSFTSVDATNVSSVVCFATKDQADSWIISPFIDMPLSDSKLEFYAYYDTRYINESQINLSVSTDDCITWVQKWTSGNVIDNDNTGAWYKQNVDLSEYAGQKIKLGWSYVGTRGTNVAIDNVMVYAPNPTGVAVIAEGDSVSYTDKSTGPPVTWYWEFEGGDKTTSSEQYPIVVYKNAGTYKTTLKIINNLGTDNKEFNGAVIVKVYPPVANFEAKNGYTRKANYGRFIPIESTISFSGSSLHYPRTWRWLLEGAQPASATTKQIEAKYNKKGKYDVRFEATNSAGTDVVERLEYISVGDSDSIWNMPTGDDGTLVIVEGDDYWTGTNRMGNDAFCERFDAPMSCGEIKEIKILFDVQNNTSGTLNVSIYNDDNGVPNSAMATVELPVNQINATGYTTISFPDPVGITDVFYVVVKGFYNPSPLFKVAIKSSDLQKYGNTAYFYKNGEWFPYSTINTSVISKYRNNISLNIVPIFTYTDGLDVAPQSFTYSNATTAGQNITVLTNIGWQATTTSPWITIENGKGSGNGSFVIKCIENTDIMRIGSVVVWGGGLKQIITVKQQGVIPSNLVAVVTGNLQNQVQLNWEPAVINGNTAGVTYVVYRNDSKIGQTNNNFYLDRTAADIGNNLCYRVIAVYGDGKESKPTNTACVFVRVAATGVQLTPDKISLKTGNTHKLIANVQPTNASDKTIKSWVSMNPYVAEVDKNGVITAKNYGITTVIATTNDGNYTATCSVTSNTVDEGEIKATEGFSPNGDGVNDYFIVQRIEEYPNNELSVFDRNGVVCYYTKSYTNNWDGVANCGIFTGQKLPPDTYYYRLKAGNKFNLKAFVVIKY